MPNVLNLMSQAVGQGNPKIIFMQVSENQPAPSFFSDPLYLVQPDWNPRVNFPVYNWPACHGETLPPSGNDAVCLIDDQNNLRCVWWDGNTTLAVTSQGDSAPMVAGTVTIPDPNVMDDSLVQVSRQASEGSANPGAVFESARVPGTSFTVESTNAADTGTVAYLIVNGANRSGGRGIKG